MGKGKGKGKRMKLKKENNSNEYGSVVCYFLYKDGKLIWVGIGVIVFKSDEVFKAIEAISFVISYTFCH